MSTEDPGPWLAPLLQMSDSALPIGAYAHSFGCEGLVQAGAIRDQAGLERFMRRELLSSLAEVDLPLYRHARTALDAGDHEALATLDRLARAVRPTAEIRAASGRMGRQLARLAPELTGSGIPGMEAGLPERQAVTVAAAVHAALDIPVMYGLHSLAWQALSGAAQAGLKLLLLGPATIQAMLARASGDIGAGVEASLGVDIDDIGSFTPLWDIASARHERAPARLFIS